MSLLCLFLIAGCYNEDRFLSELEEIYCKSASQCDNCKDVSECEAESSWKDLDRDTRNELMEACYLYNETEFGINFFKPASEIVIEDLPNYKCTYNNAPARQCIRNMKDYYHDFDWSNERFLHDCLYDMGWHFFNRYLEDKDCKDVRPCDFGDGR